VVSRKIGNAYIPEYRFKCTDNKTHVLYHVQIDSVLYLRCSDVWAALTLDYVTKLPRSITVSGEIERVLIGRSVGCSSTRPVFALTVQQTLEVCAAFSRGKDLDAIPPVEKWIREKVIPVMRKAGISESAKAADDSRGLPAWTPDDIPKIALVTPLPKRVKAKEEPQPEIDEPRVEPETLKISHDGPLVYSIALRYPGEKTQELKGEKWMLPAVHWEGNILWPERIAIDINDIKDVAKITSEDIEGMKEILWAKNGGERRLVDKMAWQRIKALPAVKSDPILVSAFDAFFSPDAGQQDAPAPAQPKPVNIVTCAAILPMEPVKPQPAPISAMTPVPSTIYVTDSDSFAFTFNGRHVTKICAAKDEDGCVWVDIKGLEVVFGRLETWPQALRNAKRRVIHSSGVPHTAMQEADIADLRQAMTPSEMSSGTSFVRWLSETIKPMLKPSSSLPLESKIATFFFKGINYEIHVSSDIYGEIWASIQELEDLFDLKVKNWPDRARTSQKKMITYSGRTFSAVSEEYIDDIAESAPPSRKSRAKSFSTWWTDVVWAMFSKAGSPPEKGAKSPVTSVSPAPQSGSLIDQARAAARLLLKLADENEGLIAENGRLKAALDSAEKAQQLIAKQKEALKSMIKSLE
jgi:hypothetical protein